MAAGPMIFRTYYINNQRVDLRHLLEMLRNNEFPNTIKVEYSNGTFTRYYKDGEEGMYRYESGFINQDGEEEGPLRRGDELVSIVSLLGWGVAGAHRSRKNRKSSRKNRKSRKSSRKNRKSSRKH